MLIALLLLVLAVPAGAEVRVVDTATGATTVPVRSHTVRLGSWSEDALRVERDGLERVSLVDGSVAPEPEWLRYAYSIGPGDRSLAAGETNGVELRAPGGRVVADRQLGIVWDETPIAWSPDGGRVAIAPGDRLVVLDTATGAVLLRRRGWAEITRQAFAPDGSALLATVGSRVLRIEVPTGVAKSVYTGERFSSPQAAWSATGRMAFTVPTKIAIPGSPGVHIPVSGPALWSPDGTTLAYLAAINPDCEELGANGVALVTPGEPPRTLIEPGTRRTRTVQWAPTGTRLAIDLGAPERVDKRGKRHPWPKTVGRDFAMFTRAGNTAVRRTVLRAARALKRGETREAVMLQFRKDYAAIAARSDGANDTDVEEALADELEPWLVAAGFSGIGGRSELTC